MIKDINRLSGKKVKIITKIIGTGHEMYEGIILGFYTTGQCVFVELDSGEIINTLYILNITIIG